MKNFRFKVKKSGLLSNFELLFHINSIAKSDNNLYQNEKKKSFK